MNALEGGAEEIHQDAAWDGTFKLWRERLGRLGLFSLDLSPTDLFGSKSH